MIVRLGLVVVASIVAYAVKQINVKSPKSSSKKSGNGEELPEQRGYGGDEKEQLDGWPVGNQLDLDDPEFEDFLFSREIEYLLPSDKYDTGREEREKVYQTEMANNANELERLQNLVKEFEEREVKLEGELLEYYGLKEQESDILELQKQLKIKTVEIDILNITINTLQAEKQKLQEELFHGATARKDLEAARSKIKELQRQMQLEANQTKAQLLLLKQRVTGLQEKEEEAFKRDSEVDKKLKLVKELEVEVMELKRKNKELQHEKRELVIKLDAAESKIAKLSNMTEHTNEDLLKQVEALQMNRFSEVEELVYLRWVNACLRFELRNYQTPQGKVSARDLSKSLSPRSQQKAKQLMLEYTGSERGQGDTDLESYFSQPSSPEVEEMGSRGGKDDSSVLSSPASLGGASPGRMSMSVIQRGPLESLMLRNVGDGVAITTFGTAEEYDSPETPKLPSIRTRESSAEALNSVASSFSLMSKSVEGVLDEKYPAFKDSHKLAVEREKQIKVKAEQARAARFERSLPPKHAQLKEKCTTARVSTSFAGGLCLW
ncbi:Protein CHUP1, chloroplastic [Capsicum baccatum]|uniref:Protein CHUP1, chloroplastic n=1 Tax=Capsicum baccatum TaxID=33114 RepID=A0A2G2V5E9_CAPBA|nr:Protein CHUP1, chloroplastic [Capsicum baccatum]